LIHIISLFIFLYTMCNQKYLNANVQVKQSFNGTKDYNLFLERIFLMTFSLF